MQGDVRHHGEEEGLEVREMATYHKGPCSVCGDPKWSVAWRDTESNELFHLCAKHRVLRDPPSCIRSEDIQEPRECTLYDALVAERIRCARLAEVERERDEARAWLCEFFEPGTSWPYLLRPEQRAAIEAWRTK